MRLLTILLFLFSIYNLSAQNLSANKSDTTFKANRAKISAEQLKRSLNLLQGRSPMYVLNDKLLDDTLVDKILGNVSTTDILEIKVLKDSLGPNVYTQRPPSPIVVVTTLAYAQKEYQKKLSLFSADYRKYVERQGGNGILYIIEKNGDMASPKGDNLIRELYNIPADSINEVRLNRKETCCGTNIFVTISIKQ